MPTIADYNQFPQIKVGLHTFAVKSRSAETYNFLFDPDTNTQSRFNKYVKKDADFELNVGSTILAIRTEGLAGHWDKVKQMMDAASLHDEILQLLNQSVFTEYVKTVEYQTVLSKALIKIPLINAQNLKAAKNGAVLKAEVFALAFKPVLVIGDSSNAYKGHLSKEVEWLKDYHPSVRKVGTVTIKKGSLLGTGSLEFSSSLKIYAPKLKLLLAEFTKKKVL